MHVQKWICDELLDYIDDSAIYNLHAVEVQHSTAHISLQEERAVNVKDVTIHGDRSRLSSSGSKFPEAEIYPGILLPKFITNIFSTLNKNCHNTVTQRFSRTLLKKIVHKVCSMEITHTSAALWILRAFNDREVYEVIPRCLTPDEVTNSILVYLQSRLSSSEVMKIHIINYMIPILLNGTDLRVELPREMSLEGLLTVVRAVMTLGFDNFSREDSDVAILKLKQRNAQLFQHAVLLGVKIWREHDERHASEFKCLISSIRPESFHELTIMHCVLKAGESEECEEASLFLEKMLSAITPGVLKLYSTSYMTPDMRVQIMNVLKGFSVVVEVFENDVLLGVPRRRAPVALGFLRPLLLDSLEEIIGYVEYHLSLPFYRQVNLLSVNEMRVCARIVGSLLSFIFVDSDLPAQRKVMNVETIYRSVSKICIGLLENIRISYETLFDENEANDYEDVDILALMSAEILSCLLNAFGKYLRALNKGGENSMTSAIDCNELMESLTSVLQQMFIFEVSPSSKFCVRAKCRLQHISSLNRTVQKLANPIHEFAEQIRFFSKFVALFSCSKWNIVRCILEISVNLGSVHFDRLLTSTLGEKLRMIEEELSICTLESMINILRSSSIIFGCLITHDSRLWETQKDLCINVLDFAWETILGFESFELRLFVTYIKFAFDPVLLRALPFEISVGLFEKIYELGLHNKPYLIQYLMYQLVPVWILHPDLSIPFFPMLLKILLYKEVELDEHSVPDVVLLTSDDPINTSASPLEEECNSLRQEILQVCQGKLVSRFFVLSFFEFLLKKRDTLNPSLLTEVEQFLKTLLEKNITKEMSKPITINSERFYEKLRLWQSLCVMAPWMSADIVADLTPLLFESLEQVYPHSIRVHVEIFGAYAMVMSRNRILHEIVDKLNNFNIPSQVLTSYFVILGHLFYTCGGFDDVDVEEILSIDEIESLVLSLSCWFTCAPGLPRCVAQLLGHVLIPKILVARSNSDPYAIMLKRIYDFIEQNIEVGKVLIRQRQFFADYRLIYRTTIRGLADLPIGNDGDRLPVHILTQITEFFKAHILVMHDETTRGMNSSINDVESDVVYDENVVLQTKRIPFSELQLAIRLDTRQRQRNYVGRRRQDVVICASLVDKPTNLAGIARTCEVFAVKSLLVPDLKICKAEAFQSIAVSSANWLNMHEVHPRDLVARLRAYKREGYTILGLEQTDSSRSLNDLEDISCTQCILVLGKEKEGIPVGVLQEIDICVEIPQFGVIRSLNVHVSAAIAIWELTKKNLRHMTLLGRG